MSKVQQGRYIDPLIDVAFKRIFGSGGSKKLLIHFLNQVFRGRKIITDLTYNENEHPGETEYEGGVVFDLLCTGDAGERFLIEVQRSKQKHFRERALFYTSKLIVAQAPKGKRSEWKYNIDEVYLVALLEDFRISEHEKNGYLHDICLCNRDTREVFYDKLGFTFIQLSTFVKGEAELETDLDWWLYLLKNLSRFNRIPAILSHSVFESLFHIAEYSKLPKEEKMLYDASLKARWDNKNAMDYAVEQAEARGAEKERAKAEAKILEEKRNIARELKKLSVPIVNISKSTGLSSEEIEAL